MTGVPFTGERLDVLRGAPAALVRPSLKARVRVDVFAGQAVALFEVDWSPDVHQLTDGRYVLRIGESNLPFPASDIESMKDGKRRRATESPVH